MSRKVSATTTAAATGTMIGTPRMEVTAALTDRSTLRIRMVTASSTASATAPTQNAAGDVTDSCARARLRRRSSPTSRYPPTTTAKNAHPAHSGRLLFMTARIAGSRTGMVPPEPMTSSMTPCSARNAASVTTKDGMPRKATMLPSTKPTKAPVRTAASTATGQGAPPLLSSTASTAAEAPAV